jgi:DNA-binding GntR family transcriptional regulator
LNIPINQGGPVVQTDISNTNQNDTVPIAAAPDAERSNNTLRAYREIRRRIMDNEMPAGAQYLEQELAEMLGMSRTPVREALIRLADERLVEVRPRHGARVLAVSADDMVDIYEILAELEINAVRRVATQGLSDVDFAYFDDACIRMVAAAKAGDTLAWIMLDQAFHVRLVAASGNARMAEMVKGLMDQAHRARRQSLTGEAGPHASNTEHAALLDAIRRRDPADAARILQAHRARVKALLVSQLQASAVGPK